MNNTIYTSFAGLFSLENICIKEIIIPKIQRGYAQGREDNHATRTRNRFLQALYAAIKEDKELTLDFIYGHNKEGELIPLDGQQRLTTLFLLYWFASRKENIPNTHCEFLNHFTYATRYSARDFCKQLIAYNPYCDGFNGKLSDAIKDQQWFPMDWMYDGTVSSMLVMLDAIQSKFSDIDNLYTRLNKIQFYFLPIDEMGLTDDIYIKMNSRGKPLTDFENFKAEMEKTFKSVNEEKANKIAYDIDTKWTDLLWSFAKNKNNASGNPTIDDSFLIYFRFICDILFYKQHKSPTINDDFQLLETFFTGNDAEQNIDMFIEFFNCWSDSKLTNEGRDIEGFFKSFACNDQHTSGKILLTVKYNINLFESCLNDCSVKQGDNRKIYLRKAILLYAVIIYLQNESTITHDEFTERFRIVNNLVANSPDEISDNERRAGGNRMPAILLQVDSIIRHGIISDNIEIGDKSSMPNFNVIQLKEEKEKQEFRASHPEYIESLNTLEDHNLLTGQIAIVGCKRPDLFDKFKLLFECDWDLVDCALFTQGDYSQRVNSQRVNYWQIQVGTSNKSLPSAWSNLFHQGKSSHFDKTQECLRSLLDTLGKDISNEKLQTLINDFIANAESASKYEWYYYYVKYPSFRIGRYGKYWQEKKNPYHVVSIYASSRPSSNSKELFLSEMNGECIYVDYKKTTLNDRIVSNEDDKVIVYKDENIELDSICIKKSPEGLDLENRIIKGKEFLKKYSATEIDDQNNKRL